MRIKLPENFGGFSHNGEPVALEPDEDGCVHCEDGVAQALLAHGGTVAPDVSENNAEVDAEAEAHTAKLATIEAKRQRGR